MYLHLKDPNQAIDFNKYLEILTKKVSNEEEMKECDKHFSGKEALFLDGKVEFGKVLQASQARCGSSMIRRYFRECCGIYSGSNFKMILMPTFAI